MSFMFCVPWKKAQTVPALSDVWGECHFNTGNLMARRRIEQAQQILDTIGVGGKRARMFNLSSSEGPRFAQYATDFTAEIKELGPNPLKLAKKKAA